MWLNNQKTGQATILYAYSLGKAQRVLSMLNNEIGPIVVHPTIETMNQIYRDSGIPLPETIPWSSLQPSMAKEGVLLIVPPGTQSTQWQTLIGNHTEAYVSGWMKVRGIKRRQNMERGFIISDHADWPSLLQTIQETRAENIWVTHGYTATLVRFFTEMGLSAKELKTQFRGDQLELGDDHSV